MDNITKEGLNCIFDEYSKLWEEKNKQYGATCDKLHEEFGDVYFDIMLQQKLNRIKQLSITDSTFESKRDSLIDLMGYTAMYIARVDIQGE